MSILEAISPTSRELLGAEVFAIGYTWNDPALGELQASTVVFSTDAQMALASFRSRNRHVTNAWIITDKGAA